MAKQGDDLDELDGLVEEELEEGEGVSPAAAKPVSRRPMIIAGGLVSVALVMVVLGASEEEPKEIAVDVTGVEAVDEMGITGSRLVQALSEEGSTPAAPPPATAPAFPVPGATKVGEDGQSVREGWKGVSDTPTPEQVQQFSLARAQAKEAHFLRQQEMWRARSLESAQRKYEAEVSGRFSSSVVKAFRTEDTAGGGAPGSELEGVRGQLEMLQDALRRAQQSGQGGPAVANLERQLAAAAASLGLGAGGGDFGAFGGGQQRNDVARREAEQLSFFRGGGGAMLPGGELGLTRQFRDSPYVLAMGAVIPGTLVTGINSDLPGQIVGQIGVDVYDSATGQHLLIPRGSQVVGVYNAMVGTGESRVQIAWNRINFPDGSFLDLEGMPGTDPGGYSGFRDKVNRHVGRRLGLALLLSTFAVGYELTQANQGQNVYSLAAATQRAGANAMYQMGRKMVEDELDRGPTLEIRPGYMFNIAVTQDIVFPGPYVPARLEMGARNPPLVREIVGAGR